MKNLKSYWPEFRPHVWKILLAFIFSALATGGSFVSTHMISVFVDKISSFEFSSISWLILTWFIIELMVKAFSHISAKVLLLQKVKIITQLRFKLLRKINNSTVESVGENDPVSLAASSHEDANIFINALHSIYGEVFNLALGIAALVYTTIVAWQLAILLILSFAIILLVQYFAIKRMVAAQKKARTASVSTYSLLVQAFQAFSDIKVQKLKIKPHVTNHLETEVQSNVKAEKIVLNNQLLSEILSIVVQSIFLIVSTILILSSKLDLGKFVAIFMYKSYVFSLVGAILRIAKNKSQANTAVQRMNSILNSETVTQEVWGTSKLMNPSGEVIIKDLTVKYGDTPVIDNISMKFPSGSFIGIVGDSGCGKSTLLKVLAKAVTPTSGSISMDGFELSDLDERSYRKAITLAPQNSFLFDFTIKQNMLLANSHASDEFIWKCLKKCAADGFVLEKGGLDTKLTPKELSGGQRQRLALARIPLRSGKVVLLDESTSALDGESQALVLKTIRDAANMGHTMVLVAHRVSTLKDADQIFVMENGKILETGTYDELYEKSEKFKRFANLG